MGSSAVSEYGYINAKLRTRMGGMLTEEFRSHLKSASSVEEAVQFLQDSGFEHLSEVWKETGDIQGVEYELFVHQLNNYKSVLKSTTGNVRQLVELLASKPEIENIKNVLRLWYGSQVKHRPVGYRASYIHRERVFQNIDWTALVNAVRLEDIRSVFSKTIYSSVFSESGESIQEEGIFTLETRLDKLYYANLLEQSRFLNRSDYAILNNIVSTEIDLQNISWIMRYRQFYSMELVDIQPLIIPGGSPLNPALLSPGANPRDNKTVNPAELLKKKYPNLRISSHSEYGTDGTRNSSKSIEQIEVLLDETRKELFSKIITGYPFTVGIIFAYFFMCEREQRFIASVLNEKFYQKNV